MITWTGIVRVANDTRNNAVEPRNRRWANAYPARVLTVTLISATTSAMATEFPNQVATGNEERTERKFARVNVRGQICSAPPSRSGP